MASRTPVQILITMDENGQIQVQGPIQDKLLMYGLLSITKDIIRDYKVPSIETIQILPPNIADILKKKQ